MTLHSILAPPKEGTIDEIQRRFEEPDWLSEVRRGAWRRYDEMPMPDRSDERWRRTDVSKLDMNRIRPSQHARMEEQIGFLDEERDFQQWAHHREALLNQGVMFGGFSEVLRTHEDAFRKYLEGEVGLPADADKFEMLARALGTDGYAVYVPAGQEVLIPLRALTLSIEENLEDYPDATVAAVSDSLERDNANACVYPRSLIVAEAGSRVTVIEDFHAEREIGPYFSAGLTEIFVGRGAEVTIVSLHDWSEQTWNFHTQRSHVEAGGRIVTLSVHLGGKVTKANVEGVLLGPDAQSQMLGIVYGDQKQHFDLYTLQDHQGNATQSNLLFKTALREESKAIYSGLIRVGEGVQGADAYQSNRNLLLSDKAKADSQPMLEILNNDVRCTHGASMGPVDQEQLFYLQARGLPEAEAARLVVQGFFHEALAHVRDEDTRAWIHDRIAAEIGGIALELPAGEVIA